MVSGTIDGPRTNAWPLWEDAVKVFLEDERDPLRCLPDMGWWLGREASDLQDWIWVKTALEAIALLEAGGVTEVSHDHDLGEREGVGDGYNVLLWIERRIAADETYEPPAIHIHTSNISARERMELAVRGIGALLTRWGQT